MLHIPLNQDTFVFNLGYIDISSAKMTQVIFFFLYSYLWVYAYVFGGNVTHKFLTTIGRYGNTNQSVTFFHKCRYIRWYAWFQCDDMETFAPGAILPKTSLTYFVNRPK